MQITILSLTSWQILRITNFKFLAAYRTLGTTEADYYIQLSQREQTTFMLLTFEAYLFLPTTVDYQITDYFMVSKNSLIYT